MQRVCCANCQKTFFIINNQNSCPKCKAIYQIKNKKINVSDIVVFSDIEEES
jgi:hypothetical protein